MDDYFIFNETELERVGVLCPKCETEAVFDLRKDQTANETRECPGCGSTDFLVGFTTDARQNYNWITYYKRVRELKKAVGIRLYFRKTNT